MTELRQYADKNSDAPQTWPELPDAAAPLPDFPVDALPDQAAEYVVKLSASLQVDPAMTVCFMLGTASAAIVGRITAKPKRGEAYSEAVQLFMLCQGEPGERKSAVLNAIVKPLYAWLDRQRKNIQERNEDTERALKVCQRGMQRAQGDKLDGLLRQEKELQKKLIPEPLYLLSDATLEALAQHMAEHDGKAVVLSDEANLLNVLCGRSYSRDGAVGNLDAVLNAYNNGSVHGQRIGREAWHIERASLAMCLGVQPSLLETFAKDKQGNGRGLQGRFLFFLPTSMYGKLQASAPRMPESCSKWWAATVNRLAGMPEKVMDFDLYAEAAYLEWWNAIEARKLRDLDGDMRSWTGKLCGNAVRLAALFALLDGADTVMRKHWNAAAHIADSYLIPCAKRVFCGIDAELSADARLVLSKITGKFLTSKLWNDRARFALNKDHERFDAAIAELQQRGYIRASASQPAYSGSGRRPSVIYDVNPALLAQKDQETEVLRL